MTDGEHGTALAVQDRPSGRHHLRAAWRTPGFRRLFRVRLTGQFGDGVFQASLAGAVLFDPERAGHAADIAAGFAVLLLPYSLIGPFAGVLLDRWWRRQVLAFANIVRGICVLGIAAELALGVDGVPFYASALVVISLSRFVLSALSAALPRVVAPAELVTANAATSTLGTIVAALGGGTALGIRTLLGDRDSDYAVIAALALVPFVLAGVQALFFAPEALGPSAEERQGRETLAAVARGLRAGLRELRAMPLVARALGMVGVHRLLYGLWTVSMVLLYRNYFTADGVFRAGIAGLSQIVAGVAIGGGLASLLTPAAFRRWGPAIWPAALLLASGVVELAFVVPSRLPGVLLSALLLAFTSQGIKISVDTVIQSEVGDRFRGRVFACYDMLFNVALVLAAVLTAVALPEDGHSALAAGIVAAAWAVVAGVYLSRSLAHSPDPAGAAAPARSPRTTS